MKIYNIIDHLTIAVELSLNTFLNIHSGAVINIAARNIETTMTIANIVFLAIRPCL